MPIFLAVYIFVPPKFKNLVLFIGSVIFYAVGEIKYTALILAVILFNYLLTRWMAQYEKGSAERTAVLILALGLDIGTLAIFKYAGFLGGIVNSISGLNLPVLDIALPLGISFYTFQIMSYVIDVYRGKIAPARNILKVGTYIVMFPQLIAGPIVIYSKVSKELDKRVLSMRGIEDGLKTFTLGLGSKVILANQLGNIWNSAQEAGFANISSFFAWIAVLSYTLQLYFDFNGYSLMAIGLGRMLGFHYPENFNYPYISSSVSEFWKRWHMTLTAWFRDYLYIPLGGNRRGIIRTRFNMFIVWVITGLWHGAAWNFVLWGIYHFCFLVMERLFLGRILNLSIIFSRIYTIVVVMCGWVLFATDSLEDAGNCLVRLFVPHAGTGLSSAGMSFALLIAGIFFSTPIFRKWYDRRSRSIIVTLILFVIFWASVFLLTSAVYNPFLYFRF